MQTTGIFVPDDGSHTVIIHFDNSRPAPYRIKLRHPDGSVGYYNTEASCQRELEGGLNFLREFGMDIIGVEEVRHHAQ